MGCGHSRADPTRAGRGADLIGFQHRWHVPTVPSLNTRHVPTLGDARPRNAAHSTIWPFCLGIRRAGHNDPAARVMTDPPIHHPRDTARPPRSAKSAHTPTPRKYHGLGAAAPVACKHHPPVGQRQITPVQTVKKGISRRASAMAGARWLTRRHVLATFSPGDPPRLFPARQRVQPPGEGRRNGRAWLSPESLGYPQISRSRARESAPGDVSVA